MTVCLRLLDLSGRPTGKTFEFDAHDCFIVGRDANAHCRITNDPAISRHHFMLEVVPPEVRVKDLGSTNGIYVNGVLYGGKKGRREADGSLPVVSLKHGDRIRIGQTQIEVVQNIPPTEHASPSSGAASPPASSGGREGRPSESGRDVASGFDRFCDQCGKNLSETSAVQVDGKTLCMTCRLVDQGGLSGLVRAHSVFEEAPPEIPGYQLVKKIGRGGMGVVYRAKRLEDGADVAIKVLRPPGSAANKAASDILFRREIAISRSLDNENVVAFLDNGGVGTVLYLVMEFLPGGSLWRRIAKKGPVMPPTGLRWMRQVVRGLAAAHKMQLVHRDLKPANILLDRPGDDANVKIADFGLAKSLRAAGLSGFTATGMTAGTTTCMPPEQLADFKRVSASADVFSAGATFYEMLAGRSPYNFKKDKEPVATVLAFDLTPLSKRRPELPASLSAFIDRCLLSDPLQRYPDAVAMEEALAEVRIDDE